MIRFLHDVDRKTLECGEDLSKFRFGDGKEVLSETSAKIPAYLANQKVMINASVVETGIALLPSRPAMEKSGNDS